MSDFYRDNYSHQCIDSLFCFKNEEVSSQIELNRQYKDTNLEQDALPEESRFLSIIRNPELSVNGLIWTITKLASQMTILFLIDVFLLFPICYSIMVFELFASVKEWYQESSSMFFWHYLQVNLLYLLDIVLSGCVISITFAMVLGVFLETDPIYYFLQKTCFQYFIIFILLATFTEMHKDGGISSEFTSNLAYKLRQEHLLSIGLGGFHTKFLTEYSIVNAENNERIYFGGRNEREIETRKKRNFFNQIQGIANELNIDLSLFYYSTFQRFSLQREYLFYEREDPYMKFLEKNGETTKVSGRSGILWSSYKDSNRIWEEGSLHVMIYICVVFVKIIFPLWYMKNDKGVEIKFVELFNITGFYVYLIGTLYLTLRNEDFEQRNRLMRTVNNLIDFKNRPQESCQYYFYDKLDVTCTTSLECWDNARQITCMLDKKKTILSEASYLFLSFYYIFISIVCASIYGEIYIIFDENSIYMQPVMVVQMTFDFLIITTLFFVRLYYGSMFNENFPKQVELVDKLTGIYEDIVQSYDLYFAPGFVNKVKNNLYQKIIEQVEEKSKRYTQPNENGVRIMYRGVDYTNTNGKVLMINIMQLNMQTLDKIRKQILRDQNQYKHLFFGLFDLPFKETISTALLFFLTLTPAIFKKLESSFNPNTHPPAAAPAPTPSQINHLHSN